MIHPLRAALVTALVVTVLVRPSPAGAQDDEDRPSVHLMSGGTQISKGIPRFCAEPTVVSTESGAWSSPTTWSTKKVPAADDMVMIKAGHALVYDQVSDVALKCLDIEGRLTFSTRTNTRLTVGTLTILPSGTLELGTVRSPIPPAVRAELVIADQEIDPLDDVEQFGTGLIGQGTVRMHGAPKTPTFTRLAAEPMSGHTVLTLDRPVAGWTVGDRLVVPDTRQLRQSERGDNYVPQWEEAAIAAIDGATVTLTAPLAFDHRGARNGDGVLEFLPHVANLSRNVIVRSQNPSGTRGHVIFTGRPDVDLRFALFKDLGRTQPGPLDNAVYDAAGVPRNFGLNQVGRYSLHMHHVFGPEATPASGYQFVVIGNAVDGATKWGITIHDSHYGLVRDNVVYDAHGAAFVTEDGTESFNLFEHNFAMRSSGSGEFAPRSGYAGPTADPGGEGSGFWLRGPNNILRDNVAANVDVFGFAVAAGGLGTVRIPSRQGADPSKPGEFVELDATAWAMLEFAGNEAYGAMQTGVAIGWNASLSNTRVWHTSRAALSAFPTDRLTVDGFVARGDPRVLAVPIETPTGIWLSNYAAKTIAVRNSNIQGFRVGILSPFFTSVDGEPGRGEGVATIENSVLQNYIGVSVATAHVKADRGAPAKRAVVRNTVFRPLGGVAVTLSSPAAISMNYGVATGDPEPRTPLVVYDFNGKAGDTFRVYYSLGVTPVGAACGTTRPGIAGFACAGAENAPAIH